MFTLTQLMQVKAMVPPGGKVTVVVCKPAVGNSPLPVSLLIRHPKGQVEVPLETVRTFVRSGVRAIRERLDAMDIPRFDLDKIKDDTSGALISCIIYFCYSY
jgi:hypothetical protein